MGEDTTEVAEPPQIQNRRSVLSSGEIADNELVERSITEEREDARKSLGRQGQVPTMADVAAGRTAVPKKAVPDLSKLPKAPSLKLPEKVLSPLEMLPQLKK